MEVEYSQHAVAAAHYASSTRLVLTVSASATAGAVIAAINGARHNGAQLIVASTWLNAASDEVGYLAIGGHPLTGGRDAITSAREPLSFEYAPEIGGDVETDAFLLICLPTDRLSAIKALIEGFSFGAHEPFANAVTQHGSDTDTIASSVVPSNPGDAEESVGFAGGVNATPVSFAVDGDAETITATWSSIHSLYDLVAASTDEVLVTAVPDTYLPNAPTGPGDTIPFDFDAVGEATDGTVVLKEVHSEDLTFASAAAWVDTTLDKPADLEGDEVWWFYTGGEEGTVGEPLVPVRVDRIPTNDTGGAANDASGLRIAYNLSYYMHLRWHAGSGKLQIAMSNANIDPAPLTIYRLQGQGQRGPRGRAGVSPESRTVTLKSWRDNNDDVAVPSDATETTVVVGRFAPLTFPAASTNKRYLHLAVDDAYEVASLQVAGLETIGQYTEQDEAGEHVYHSPRLKTREAVSALVLVEEAA